MVSSAIPTKILYVVLIRLVRATFSTHLILLV
jgi:hypothetical protein